MKKSYIISVLVLGVFVLGYVLSVQRGENKESVTDIASGKEVARISVEKTPNGVLVAEEKSYDFGTISMAAGKVSRTFTLKNTGSVPAMVKKVFTSCMCTTASLMTKEGKAGPFGMAGHAPIPEINKSVASGDEASIIVTFDPAAHGPSGTGKIRRVVYMEQEGSDKPLELVFEANVTK